MADKNKDKQVRLQRLQPAREAAGRDGHCDADACRQQRPQPGRGLPIGEPRAADREKKSADPSRRQPRTVLGAVKDASRRDAVASQGTRPSLTAPSHGAGSRGRSAPGNGPDSLTRKCQPETPLLRRTKRERAAT